MIAAMTHALTRALRLRLTAAAALSLLAVAACADAPRQAPAPAPRGAGGAAGAIASAFGAALADASGLSGALGFIVVDLATGETLEALNPDLGLAPASVAKIATTLYALAILGPQHRFETQAVALGPIGAGRLRGDLGLRGGGDPELDSAGLAALARDAAAQAQVVDGAVRVAPGAVIPFIDAEQPPEAAYNPAVAALNLNYNRVRLAWERKGARLEYALEAHAASYSPAVTSVALNLAPDDCGCPAFARADGPGETWRVREGALRGRGSVWLPVQAPEPYAAEVFRAAAAQAGMRFGAAQQAGGTGGGKDGAVIARHLSRPVIEMTADMLRYSTNLTAEALGRAASAARGAAVGDLAASAAAMNRWIADFAGFAAEDGFSLRNHSGLSADARVTPRRMAQVLAAAARGGDAALFHLLRDHAIDDADARAPKGATVRAKTGTLDFARGLAGYAVTPSGRRLAFAYFANDLDRRAATLAASGRAGRPAGARAWRNKAVRLERALLRGWLTRFD
ncbi:MAG: D-alanyl-D-alanine carboxypeptidase/D-alanyl-D-alanine-endopeptidase [Rhodobacterales bacterium CG_4_9_14_3_um_filter_71_31]|nr:MAG: D-alanyl-D-alanine carboxypeptidase/D-alanyl-D-alanine-endopeptidase [Rhodobacterales bacterium CG_4_9_14_3_um_filter_71_31]